MADEKTPDQIRAEIKAELEGEHKKHMERVNGEAAASRKELEAAAARLKEFEDKEAERERLDAEAKGEFSKVKESLEKENATLKANHTKELNKLTAARLVDKAELAAAKAGMHDPSLIGKLVDTKEFKVNEDGTVTGIDEQITKLKESHAYLFKAEGDQPGNGEGKPRAGASPHGGNGTPGKFEVDWTDEKLDVDAAVAKLIGQYK